jgi:hypothetical protein
VDTPSNRETSSATAPELKHSKSAPASTASTTPTIITRPARLKHASSGTGRHSRGEYASVHLTTTPTFVIYKGFSTPMRYLLR